MFFFVPWIGAGGVDGSKESTIYMVWTGLTSDLLREFLMFFVFFCKRWLRFLNSKKITQDVIQTIGDSLENLVLCSCTFKTGPTGI